MNELEKAAIEALLFGGEPGQRVTRAVRIRSATLDRVPAEKDVRYITDEEESYYPPSWFWGELSEGGDFELEGFGSVSSVVQEGGEGQGDSYYFVISVTDSDGDVRFFRGDGYYSSYDGVNWEGTELYEVQPREKTIVVYQAV